MLKLQNVYRAYKESLPEVETRAEASAEAAAGSVRPRCACGRACQPTVTAATAAAARRALPGLRLSPATTMHSTTITI